MGSAGDRGSGIPPAQVAYHSAGPLASRIAARQPLVDQPHCCILATNDLDEALWPALAVRAGDKGQA